MDEQIVSRPYKPMMACERCVFGSGKHAEGCEWAPRCVDGGPGWNLSFDPENWRQVIEEYKSGYWERAGAGLGNRRFYTDEETDAILRGDGDDAGK